jgi:hypothetical protein
MQGFPDVEQKSGPTLKQSGPGLGVNTPRPKVIDRNQLLNKLPSSEQEPAPMKLAPLVLRPEKTKAPSGNFRLSTGVRTKNGEYHLLMKELR